MKLYTAKKNRKRSQKSEMELARSLGGKVQPASGALPVNALKGDVKTDRWIIDDKITSKKSFAVKSEVFLKLRKEAFFHGRRLPAIRIHFEGGPKLFVISEMEFYQYDFLLKKHLEKDAL